MNRFDDETKKLIAEIMRDCSSRADDKIAALCRRVADERAVEIAALRKKLEASDAQAINNMSLYRGELAARKNAEAELGAILEVSGNKNKWIVGPCSDCGGMSASYDGVEHEVSCPDCGHYYRDGGVTHTEVIRRWNAIACIEVKLAKARAEKAEHDLSGSQALEAQNIAALQSANAELAQLRPVVQMFVNTLKNCDSPILKPEDIDQE